MHVEVCGSEFSRNKHTGLTYSQGKETKHCQDPRSPLLPVSVPT